MSSSLAVPSAFRNSFLLVRFTFYGNATGRVPAMMAGKANTISRGGKINKTSKKTPCWMCRSAGRFCLFFWNYSLESTGRTRIVSIQYQELYGWAKACIHAGLHRFKHYSHSSLELWFRVIKCTLDTLFAQIVHVFHAVHRFFTNFVAVL